MIILRFGSPKHKKGKRREYMRETVKQNYFRLSVLPWVCPECSEPPIRSCDKAESWANGFLPLFLALLRPGWPNDVHDSPSATRRVLCQNRAYSLNKHDTGRLPFIRQSGPFKSHHMGERKAQANSFSKRRKNLQSTICIFSPSAEIAGMSHLLLF